MQRAVREVEVDLARLDLYRAGVDLVLESLRSQRGGLLPEGSQPILRRGLRRGARLTLSIGFVCPAGVIIFGVAGLGDVVDWARQQVASRVPKADLDQRDPDYIRDQFAGPVVAGVGVLPRRVGARLLNARNLLFWAQMLLSRNVGDDNERALTMLERACAIARELGSAAIVRDATNLITTTQAAV